MASKTKQVRTFDTVQVRALPEGGFVVSAPSDFGGAPIDIVAFEDVEGVMGWFDGAANPGAGFDAIL